MSKLNANGFIVQEILYSPDLRRTCSVCGSKRKIGNLVQFNVVFKGQPIRWRCSSGCFPS
jgi:hypothetical protein